MVKYKLYLFDSISMENWKKIKTNISRVISTLKHIDVQRPISGGIPACIQHRSGAEITTTGKSVIMGQCFTWHFGYNI